MCMCKPSVEAGPAISWSCLPSPLTHASVRPLQLLPVEPSRWGPFPMDALTPSRGLSPQFHLHSPRVADRLRSASHPISCSSSIRQVVISAECSDPTELSGWYSTSAPTTRALTDRVPILSWTYVRGWVQKACAMSNGDHLLGI